MNPILVKALAGVGAVGAVGGGAYGGWQYFKSKKEEKVEDVGQPAGEKEVERVRKFSEFSGYQNNLQALMHHLGENNRVNTFNGLSENYQKNKDNLNTEIKGLDPFLRETYKDLKKCNCAAESGVEDMASMDEFMGILGEISEGKESEKISRFSELFGKVHEDLKRLEKLVNESSGNS